MNTTRHPLVRVMALHALLYCERLFYLEEVEEIRLADAAVFAGRSLHVDLASEKASEKTEVDLSSDSLGLVGRCDIIRMINGIWIPYEHKKGRSKKTAINSEAWPPDSVQVTAYAMLLEEQLGVQVNEGRIRYHEDNVTISIPIDEDRRSLALAAIARAREIRDLPNRPPITTNDRMCLRCSLSPVCLPEEDRAAKNPEWEPVRLFPPDREGRTVHVVDFSAVIRRAGDQLLIQVKGKDDVNIPINDVDSLVLHGYPQITTQALHQCAFNNIPVHWISTGGRYAAGLLSGAGSVQRRIRQFKALSDPRFCLQLAKKLGAAKVETQLKYLLRATSADNPRTASCALAINNIRSCLKSISHAESADELRGHEGGAARAYFDMFPELLKDRVPPEMVPSGRSRRPPLDRFNALLSFGYSLLYQSVLTAIVSVGLDPAIGFYHTPRSSAYPLVMDLMELFRIALWDIPLIGSVNRLQWDIAVDFQATRTKVWMSSEGRKKAIRIYETRLEEKWKHPVLDYSLSYFRTLELETRLLEKEWTGETGLFAKARLR